jgi:hypothetical protein
MCERSKVEIATHTSISPDFMRKRRILRRTDCGAPRHPGSHTALKRKHVWHHYGIGTTVSGALLLGFETLRRAYCSSLAHPSISPTGAASPSVTPVPRASGSPALSPQPPRMADGMG